MNISYNNNTRRADVLDKLIEENIGLVYSIIRRLQYVPSIVDEDDLLQIGRIALWKALETYDDQTPCFSTYAYKTIYTDIISYLRTYSAQKRQPVLLPAIEEDFASKVEFNITFDMLDIDEEEKSIFKDKYVDRLSNKEISEKYGKSLGQVKYLIGQIKNKLREELDADL